MPVANTAAAKNSERRLDGVAGFMGGILSGVRRSFGNSGTLPGCLKVLGLSKGVAFCLRLRLPDSLSLIPFGGIQDRRIRSTPG